MTEQQKTAEIKRVFMWETDGDEFGCDESIEQLKKTPWISVDAKNIKYRKDGKLLESMPSGVTPKVNFEIEIYQAKTRTMAEFTAFMEMIGSAFPLYDKSNLAMKKCSDFESLLQNFASGWDFVGKHSNLLLKNPEFCIEAVWTTNGYIFVSGDKNDTMVHLISVFADED